MADAYRSLPINGDVPSSDAMPKARAAAEKALEIDPDNSDAHTALGWIAYWYDHDWARAESEFKTALALSPNNSDAHRGYSVMLTCLGRHDEAIAEMTRAREIDPLSLVTNALEGQTYLFAGQYDKAIETLHKTFEMDPNFWVGHIQLSRVYIQQGKYEQAMDEAESARKYSGGNSEATSLLGYAQAKAGRPQDALESVEILKKMQADGRVVDYNLAMIYNALGRTDDALQSLNDAVSSGDVRLILLKVDKKWDPIRSDNRFVEIMKAMNFE